MIPTPESSLRSALTPRVLIALGTHLRCTGPEARQYCCACLEFLGDSCSETATGVHRRSLRPTSRANGTMLPCPAASVFGITNPCPAPVFATCRTTFATRYHKHETLARCGLICALRSTGCGFGMTSPAGDFRRPLDCTVANRVRTPSLFRMTKCSTPLMRPTTKSSG